MLLLLLQLRGALLLRLLRLVLLAVLLLLLLLLPLQPRAHGVIGRYVPPGSDDSSIVWACAVSGNYLYTGGSDCVARAWRIGEGKMLRDFRGHKGWVTAIAVRQLDKDDILFTGSADGTVRQWDAYSGDCLGNFKVNYLSGFTSYFPRVIHCVSHVSSFGIGSCLLPSPTMCSGLVSNRWLL